MKKVFVVGAPGATGSLLVQILLQENVKVDAIVRSIASLGSAAGSHLDLQIVEAEISEISESD